VVAIFDKSAIATFDKSVVAILKKWQNSHFLSVIE